MKKMTAEQVEQKAFAANGDVEIARTLIRGFHAYMGLEGREPQEDIVFANRVDPATKRMAAIVADAWSDQAWTEYMRIAVV